jgi:hypothetical protein
MSHINHTAIDMMNLSLLHEIRQAVLNLSNKIDDLISKYESDNIPSPPPMVRQESIAVHNDVDDVVKAKRIKELVAFMKHH